MLSRIIFWHELFHSFVYECFESGRYVWWMWFFSIFFTTWFDFIFNSFSENWWNFKPNQEYKISASAYEWRFFFNRKRLSLCHCAIYGNFQSWTIVAVHSLSTKEFHIFKWFFFSWRKTHLKWLIKKILLTKSATVNIRPLLTGANAIESYEIVNGTNKKKHGYWCKLTRW